MSVSSLFAPASSEGPVADGLAVQKILNNALKEDELDDGYVRSLVHQSVQTAANEYPD